MSCLADLFESIPRIPNDIKETQVSSKLGVEKSGSPSPSFHFKKTEEKLKKKKVW